MPWLEICGLGMTLYNAGEEELEKRHQAILAKKYELSEEMRIFDEQQGEVEELWKLAHKRNQILLKDFRTLERNVKHRLQPSPDGSLVQMEGQYWARVEKELPKWELFLLGKAQQPFGVVQNIHSKQILKHSQSMEAARKKSLPPSGFKSNTFPSSYQR